MAVKTVVELVDDLDGGQADETVSFALDGVTYTIDLSAQHATRLRDVLAGFVAGARKMTSRVRHVADIVEDPVAAAAAVKAERKRANHEALKSIREATQRTAAAVKAAQTSTEPAEDKTADTADKTASRPATEIKVVPAPQSPEAPQSAPTTSVTSGNGNGDGKADGKGSTRLDPALIVPFQTAGS